MTGIKRAREEICSLCNSNIKLFDIDENKSFAMCENVECVYPFNQPDVEGLIIETPHNETRYSKKQKTHSSSVANTQPSKASDDDNNSVKSVEEFSLDDFDTSSLSMQTDELISVVSAEKELSLDGFNNITQEPPVFSAATNSASEVSSTSDQALLNQSSAKTSSSSKKFSLQDIEFLLTGNESTEEPVDNIECLSPVTANPNTPKESNTTDCSSPTSPNVTTPKDDTNLNWIEDFDVLFGEDMAKSSFNPLDGDTEFDSVLGI